MHTGEAKTRGGRAGDGSAETLSDSLASCGFPLARFKTGTPCRLNGRTIDFSKCERQPGDDEPRPFSFATDRLTQPQMDCHITYTNEAVHDLIRANLHRAPMYSGQIAGPRAALLPVRRGQGRPLRRQGPPPDLPGAGRPQYARILLQRHQHQPAQGRAAGDASPHPRPGKRRGAALGLRRRVRLRPADAAAPDAGDEAGRRISTSPARSTAPPATKRPRPRG